MQTATQMRALGRFEVKAWEEDERDDTPGLPKLTRSRIRQSFHGDLEGDAHVEFLMAYREDGGASFVGTYRVIGRLGDRWGSFVLQDSGTFESGRVMGRWAVVPGTGTGELRGLHGRGSFISTSRSESSYTLDYDFD
jgi:hypothetical protein